MANLRICFIGDSLVAGTGDSALLGWPGRIAKAARERGHDVTCYNLGIRANTSADILARWRAEADARAASGQDNRLVFEFGVNDTKLVDGEAMVSPERAVAQARSILSEATASHPTLMIGPPPIDDEERNARIAAASARLAALCGELMIPFFASFEPLKESSVWKRAQSEGDGVHPVDAGYAEWAALIDAWPAWRGWTP